MSSGPMNNCKFEYQAKKDTHVERNLKRHGMVIRLRPTGHLHLFLKVEFVEDHETNLEVQFSES